MVAGTSVIAHVRLHMRYLHTWFSLVYRLNRDSINELLSMHTSNPWTGVKTSKCLWGSLVCSASSIITPDYWYIPHGMGCASQSHDTGQMVYKWDMPSHQPALTQSHQKRICSLSTVDDHDGQYGPHVLRKPTRRCQVTFPMHGSTETWNWCIFHNMLILVAYLPGIHNMIVDSRSCRFTQVQE